MARLIDADNKQELTRKCLVERMENIISDYEQRQLSETDIEDVNYGDLKCISEALQFYQLKTCNQPTAEPPKVKGEWSHEAGDIHSTGKYRYCSNCSGSVFIPYFSKQGINKIDFDFCPNCGADMRKDQPHK